MQIVRCVSGVQGLRVQDSKVQGFPVKLPDGTPISGSALYFDRQG